MTRGDAAKALARLALHVSKLDARDPDQLVEIIALQGTLKVLAEIVLKAPADPEGPRVA